MWFDGTWKIGIWYYGTWESGTWKDGLWKNGDFVNGKIIKGEFRLPKMSKWNIKVHIPIGNITIGCKEQSIKEWDEFFYNSNEIYSTQRDTVEFKRILNNYEIAKSTYKLLTAK